MSGDAEQEFFVDGLTEDILTELSRRHELFVISRNSSFVYKDQAVNIPEVAEKLGQKLILAGKIGEGAERDYFDERIKPHLGDRVEYQGEVSEEKKLELFSKAKGYLFPIQWDEPLGITMVEALACGTPVVAFKRGAAPEVVEDGVTGYVVETMDEFVDAYNRHDAKAMAEQFTADADACVSLSRYRGRDQIASFFARLRGNDIESPSKTAAIRFLTPDVALMDVETTLTGLQGANGGELPPLLIKACFIATKKDDRWIYGALRIQTFSTSQPQ